MDTALASISPAPASAPAPALDIKTLLARINQRIIQPYWWARRMTVPEAQRERDVLRQIANLLHVERATHRGRLHGTQFPTLDAQRAWLGRYVNHRCSTAARLAQLPTDATLALLREGKLPL